MSFFFFSMCQIKYCAIWNSFIVLIVSSLYFKNAFAHVSLTFPPARNYNFDFLDNVRTKPPCGMAKGSFGTTLMAGVPLNISWHLAYPHRGGYRLELLDKDDKFLLDLIKRDKSQNYIQGDPTAQWHTVTIPKDLLCDDCTIRLLRQANEWSGNYKFWSCADVRIVQPSSYIEDCSKNGEAILVGGGSGCKCDKGWWGPRCQYEEECHSNIDCGTSGTCVDLGGTALPRNQCFCPHGLHGLRCSLKNNAKLATRENLNLSMHTTEKLSDRMSLHYKVISDDKEIEFVLVINGTSYGALGWRPVSLNKTCKLFPSIEETQSKRITRQSSFKEKLVYRPNQTLLRPLTDLERSKKNSEHTWERRQKQERQHEFPSQKSSSNNQAKVKKDHPSIPESEPEAESEPIAEAEPENEPNSKSKPTKSNKDPKPEGSHHHHDSGVAEPETEPEHHDSGIAETRSRN